MEHKPRIFIGSASSGIQVAEKLKVELSNWAICDTWAQTGVFGLNKNYLDQLLEHLNLYDYCVMVATGADETTSNGVTRISPRDNVIFELGLFMGRLGRDRTFYVFEEGAKLLSDFEGITLPKFPRRKGKAQDNAISVCAAKIKEHIDNRTGIFEGGLFPAVPLAFGYFNNFISVVCEKLINVKRAKINGVETSITDFELRILIPNDIVDDMKKKVAAARNIKNWELISVQAPETRSYDFYADVDFRDGKATLKDVPTTLLSLRQTIVEFMKITQIGENQKQRIVEIREILRFKSVLEYLISKNSYTKDFVKIEIVDI
jgi:hypothetical protein